MSGFDLRQAPGGSGALFPSGSLKLFDEFGVAIEDHDQLNSGTARFDQASLILVERIRSDPEQGASSPLGQTELGPHLADRLRRRNAIHLLLQHAQRAVA